MKVTITYNNIQRLFTKLKGHSAFEKMYDLRYDQMYELDGEIIPGEYLIRTTPAGVQYTRFQDVIIRYLLDSNVDLNNYLDLQRFLNDAQINEEHLAFYLHSCKRQQITTSLLDLGYDVPQDYYGLIKLFNEMSYGEYQDFMLAVQLFDYYDHMIDPSSPIGAMMWFSLIGKIQNHAILIRIGASPANPLITGQYEALGTHALLGRRKTDNGLIMRFPDIYSHYPKYAHRTKTINCGTKIASSLYRPSDSGTYKLKNNIITTYRKGGYEVLNYITRRFRKNNLHNIHKIDEFNCRITDTFSKMSWVFSRITDVPRINWDKMDISELRGAYNPKHATPTLIMSQPEWMRMFNPSYSSQPQRVEMMDYRDAEWCYLWNCILDIKADLIKRGSEITYKRIMKEIKCKSIPKQYIDHSIIILWSLLKDNGKKVI